jgi:ATP-dependent DNA helicase RecQ
MLSAIAEDNEPVRANAAASGGASAAGEEPLSADDANLFAALKAKRMVLAKQRKVPAYVVLTDRSLRDIARQRPRDERDLAGIHGIGAAKIEAYGDIILELVAAHSGR